MLPDYYAILEISPNATQDEIKRAYRHLARLYHPDVTGVREDMRIKQINEAYKTLSDPHSKTLYDIQRLEEKRQRVLLDALALQRSILLRQQRMTWREGVQGFVRELKKGLRDE